MRMVSEYVEAEMKYMKNCCILIDILFEFIPRGHVIYKISAFIQVMAWL